MARCRGCGANIEWIRTRAGKNMPVDPAPVFVITGTGRGTFITDDGDTITGSASQENSGGAQVGFISHFATCLAAGRFRR